MQNNINLAMRNARIPKRYQDVNMKLDDPALVHLRRDVEEGTSVAIVGSGTNAMDAFYLAVRGNIIKGRPSYCVSLAELEGYFDGEELYAEVGERIAADNFAVLGIRCFQETEANPYKPVHLGRIATLITDFINRGGTVIVHNTFDKAVPTPAAMWKWHPKFLADVLNKNLYTHEIA